MNNCIFCSSEVRAAKIMENDLAFVIYDKFPKTRGHLLIIPKRCSENFFDTTPPERAAMCELVDLAREYLDREYNPTGYNIILNTGKDAGQVVFHTHMHLIPRYTGEELGLIG